VSPVSLRFASKIDLDTDRHAGMVEQPKAVNWIFCIVLVLSLSQEPRACARSRNQTVEAYWRIPIGFEECPNQTNPGPTFQAEGLGYCLHVGATGADIQLQLPASSNGTSTTAPEATSASLGLRLAEANLNAGAEATEPLPGRSSYFIGKDPAKWRTNITRYAKVKFKQVYPGVDWICYGNQRQLEYDFTLAPGARPEVISLRFVGAESLQVDPSSGDLVVRRAGGELRQARPQVYQEINGRKRAWSGKYVIRDDKTVGFATGPFDASRALVIDPTLGYSALLGRSNELDNPFSITLDPAGNAYVAGSAVATNQVPHVFVLKLDATGTNLVYSAVFGGAGGEFPGRVAADAAGNAYVTGATKSSDFPVFQPLQPTLRGPSDAFVCKINPTGDAFLYSTYLGGDSSAFGTGDDAGFGITVDGDGSAYVTGSTSSNDLFGPGSKRIHSKSAGATRFQSSLKGPGDAFVIKLAPSGSSLVYGTYLGGGGYDAGLSIVLDSQANACIIGVTRSTDFPTANPQQPVSGGGFSDAFVAKLNATGSALLFSTYLGGAGEELPSSHIGVSLGADIAVDLADNVYVAGETQSTNFPVKNAIQGRIGGTDDGFVAKYTSQGILVYCTYLGGNNNDGAFGVAVDTAGNAYVTGGTQSTDFPTVNPLQTSLLGSSSAFVSVIDPAGSALLFSTYLGADGISTANGIALDGAGNVYLSGLTTSTNFPDTVHKSTEVRTTFVTKIAVGLAPPTPLQKLIQKYGPGPSGGFVLTVQGEKNHTYSLEFSTDLRQWILLTQFNSPDGHLDYVDTRASLFRNGFYRVR
jgi:hypothetical protein